MGTCNAAGDVAEVQGGNRATKKCRVTINRLEDSDVMPREVSSDRPPECCRKVKRIYEVVCYLLG